MTQTTTPTVEEFKVATTEVVQLLEEKGWCKGRYVDDDGRICLSQAVRLVSRRRGWAGELYDNSFYYFILEKVQQKDGSGFISLSQWNDSKTKEEVFSVLVD